MESPISVDTFIKCWNEAGKEGNPDKFLHQYGLDNEYADLMISFAATMILNTEGICHHFTMGFLFCLYCVESERVNKEIEELERISRGS